MNIKKFEAYTVSYAEYVHASSEEVEELLRQYTILGLNYLLFDSGELLLIPIQQQQEDTGV
jgi:hypothetical protein